MGINIGPPEVDELKPRIAVIGVGGAGGNAIANMIAANVEGVDFIVANTDAQALNASPADSRIQLGPDITQGLGAGSRPEVGRAAAEETIVSVEQALDGAHMCFIAAGMGGGTGTGAAPVIAKAARDKGILTVGVVTKPFTFEGTRRMRSADAGIEELQANVDTLIIIPNQNLFLVANPNTTFKEAFAMADEVLQQGVRGITDLMVMPGLINLDFADVRSVMHEMGKAMMGTGEAEGDGRALEAAEKAISNPLLDGVSMRGAKGVIISITGGEDMRLMEVDEAANHIRELVDPDANIIWGSAFNDNLMGKIRVSVVATGIDAEGSEARPAAHSRAFSFPPRKSPAVEPQAYEPQAEQAQADTNDFDATAPTHSDANSFAGDSGESDATTYGREGTEALQDADGEPFHAEPLELSEQLDPDHFAVEEQAGYSSTADELAGQAGVGYGVTDPDPIASPSIRDRVQGLQRGATDSADEEFVLDTPETPAVRPTPGGGTLFERMSKLSRGSNRVVDDNRDDKDENPLDIPRFLNRQNNQ